MSKAKAQQAATDPTLPTHGALVLPRVTVDSFNLELRDGDGFLGDRASKTSFNQILDKLRKSIAKSGRDPLGKKPSANLTKKRLDEALTDRDQTAGALVQSAIEEFAGELAEVLRRFLRQKSWHGTQSIVVGGGLRDSRVGELAIGRAAILLNDSLKKPVELLPIKDHPDEAGLTGAVQLLPTWMIAGYEAILAVDVGGTNIRAGIVKFTVDKADGIPRGSVADMRLWRHADEDDLKRDEAIEELTAMLRDPIAQAPKKASRLAPFIGVGCPGVIRDDGTIEKGAQNLPGNWESSRFNLPAAIRAEIPRIGDHETVIVVHNDAVVQGLSELARMQGAEHWGVVTIGTGFGNARFSNRSPEG